LIKVKPVFKFWLETEKGYVFGEGPATLLYHIQQLHTLSGAAKALGMSYRYAWGILREVEERIGKPVVKTHKGGKSGGGGAELTVVGVALLEQYLRTKENLLQISDKLAIGDIDFGKGLISEIRGEVHSINWEGMSAIVKVKIDASQKVKVFIERAFLEEENINIGTRVRVKLRSDNLAEETVS